MESNPVADKMQAELSSVPWSRGSWHGSLISFDDTPTDDFGYEDVKECWKSWAYGVEDWDGECCAVFQLNDGRWVAYESWWGPTGSGFSEDAYGGDANIYFAKTKEDAARFGLSKNARESLGIILED